jgi:hypothetical protein
VIDITDPDAGGVQAVANRGRRKPCRVFNAVKAFFLDGGDQAAVCDQCCGGIAVIRVDSQDVHPV